MIKKQTIRLNESQLRRIVKESVRRMLKEEESVAEKFHSDISQFIYSSLKRKYGNLLDGDVDNYVINVPHSVDGEYITISVGFGTY